MGSIEERFGVVMMDNFYILFDLIGLEAYSNIIMLYSNNKLRRNIFI